MKKYFTLAHTISLSEIKPWVNLPLIGLIFVIQFLNLHAATAQGCPPLSPLACDQLQVSLPYSLSFSGSVSGTIADKNGAGTGFTVVDAYSGTRHSDDGTPSSTSAPGYEASKLTVTGGRLQLATNKGIAYVGNNNQLNTLGVRVDSRSRLTVEVALVNPYYGTSSQQGGLWLGLNDKTYVKLVVVGNQVELRREVNDGSSSSDQRITPAVSGINSSTVRLRLAVDPATSTAEGFYSLNGGAEQPVGTALSISGMGLTSTTAYAGLFATHRNGTSSLTYTFDDFSVKGSTSSSTALVSNVSATTGKSYALADLAVGVKHYTDRTYQVTSVPSSVSGASLIQAANDDKTNTSSSLLSFDLNQNATVYVAYDPRATVLPTWLSGWQKLTDRVGVDDAKISHMDLYSKGFAAGKVSLGGNMQSPAAGAQTNYFVLAKATEAGTYTISVSTTGSGSVSKSPEQTNYASGTSVSLAATAASGYTFSGWSGDATGTANPLSVTMNSNKSIVANFTQTGTSTALVSNVTATTGKSYALADLAVGVKHYTDRTYQVTSVPSSVSGASLIRTANDDKTNTSSSLLSFDLSQNATVYVAYDPRATVLPTWLSGWQKLTERVGVDDAAISYMDIYSKGFAAGNATLAGNMQSPAAGAQTNYFVFAKATETGEDNIAPTVAVKLDGALQSPGVYNNEVTVSIQASDEGGSGLASVQYSLNGGAYTAYSAPFKITKIGDYTISGRATDGNGNQTTTDVTKFSVVESTQSNAYMVVENMDKFQAPDRLTFSLIQIPWRRKNSDGTYTPYNENHNKVRLKISNKGAGTLVVNELKFSNTTAWRINSLNGVAYDPNTALPLSLNSGASAEAEIEFIAKDLGGRVKILNDKLYISSNDVTVPYKEVKLHGLWQYRGEASNEPYAQEIIQAFGFSTQSGYTAIDGGNEGSTIIPNSDEILSAYFVRADASKPVSVIQMAAYHGCCSQTESFNWYYKGTTDYRMLFRHDGLYGQSLLPKMNGTTTALSSGTFNPTGAIGFKVSSAFSDRTLNYQGKIGMRIWKAVDANGNVIPNAYIIGTDYLGTDFTNYDYQDNVYYVENVRPETGAIHYSELGAAPSAVEFGAVMTGGSKSLTVNLKNLGKTYADGSKDPSITINRVEIVGPNSNEFSTTMPSTTTLAPQNNIGISVSFKPASLGIKNAALLVHYSSGDSPLRIPLYGIANTNDASIGITKRIKGAADVSVTISGKTWEADKSYRQGSVRLDKQNVAGPIAATDEDVLYQTYLSASSDLAETRYAIPLNNGSYMVRMHFVENYFWAEGARVFNIKMENALRLSGFDIYREVGYRSALVKDFVVDVNDGTLNINFNPTANRLAIAGVEIFQASYGASLAQSTTGEMRILTDGLKMQVYPNPNTGDKMHVALEGFKQQEKVNVTIYDIAGRVVHSTEVNANGQGASNNEIVVDKRLGRGLYIIKAKAMSGEVRTKLVIE
ncbi:malectin domain-containing carbohydrate-binding protein [Pontibacter pamirensis]|uniref:malectin domain-containing carbohydrate-binding protein n=1 Tax=Pontibacter pamirensis TaxID=2562824 RepID=UPI00138A3302|nr:malectin domain-containing carbohydrate-binding protein [Pontibacter pamirensis]